MADRIGFEKISTVRDERSKIRVLDKNFESIANAFNRIIIPKLSEIENFLDINAISLRNVVYTVAEHACQVFLTMVQPLTGTHTLEFHGEDRVDHDYFDHYHDDTPETITIKKAGWHKVTYKISGDQPFKVSVYRNGNIIQRSVGIAE